MLTRKPAQTEGWPTATKPPAPRHRRLPAWHPAARRRPARRARHRASSLPACRCRTGSIPPTSPPSTRAVPRESPGGMSAEKQGIRVDGGPAGHQANLRRLQAPAGSSSRTRRKAGGEDHRPAGLPTGLPDPPNRDLAYPHRGRAVNVHHPVRNAPRGAACGREHDRPGAG